jgi:rsbT co-antagonist protein RsbR
MTQMSATLLPNLIRNHEARILSDWLSAQMQSINARRDLINDDELRRESRDFLNAFVRAAEDGGLQDLQGAQWSAVRDVLTRLSRSRAQQGFTPSETATFVFSLKQPLFGLIRNELKDAASVASETWNTTLVLDTLGLFTTEVHQKSREDTIGRQQMEMLELSTPVVTLWQGVLALPLIGTLDSARTQVVMESLLQRIVQTESAIAILDITGVPTVDTLVAQHLLKTVAAARLMGADCIISGIRPQIAQTIVHLGVDLNTVTTKATLADAFAVALKRLGLAITKNASGPTPGQPTTPSSAAAADGR